MFLHFIRKHRKASRLTDEELIASYRRTGNGDLIAELFERYTHLVYGICLGYIRDRDSCKDAVMEIFESLFEKLFKHEVNNFKNWLYSVTKNYCLMHLRRKEISGKIKDVLLEDMRNEEITLSVSLAQETETMRRTNEEMVKSAVIQLKEEQHICIHLLYNEGKTYREISEKTGFTISEVKSHIQNGKRNLRKILVNHGDSK
jgi:RNA polymerase sigma factor (sigma-70 family)